MTTTNIHPTAVVSNDAIIGNGCTIGPYCIVGSEVEMGDNNTLESHVVIEARTKIGNGNHFFQFGSIGAVTQDLKYVGEPTYAQIGNNNTFREFVTIHRGTAPGETTTIGNNCTILAYCHIAHNCIIGNNVIMSNAATLGGHVEVADAAVIGGLSGIHQFCKIGTMTMIGGASKVVQDCLPFCVIDGAPATTRMINKIGLERNGKSKDIIRNIFGAYKIIFKNDIAQNDAIEILEMEYPDSEEIKTMIQFMKESNRGLAR